MTLDGILALLAREGPLTGGELLSRVGGDRFQLWKACTSPGALAVRRVGERFLRLDERVPGYARLSPSILREFLTYTVLGVEPSAVQARAEALLAEVRETSDRKAAIARAAASSVMERVSPTWDGTPALCFVLGGDIVYGMAHSQPRPERSTGRMVHGSDLDIVVVLDDEAPEALRASLEEEIHREKYRLLVTPATGQEIDYVVKYAGRFREQLRFDTFRRMVACKIMKEGTLLWGDHRLFDTLKSLLAQSGIDERLAAMERRAAGERLQVEAVLRQADSIDSGYAALFYASQESEEFE